jgi:hypothetical protein
MRDCDVLVVDGGSGAPAPSSFLLEAAGRRSAGAVPLCIGFDRLVGQASDYDEHRS